MTSKLIYLHMDYKISNQIVPNALFLYPLKISENLTLCFQAFEKGYIGNEWVNQLPEFEKSETYSAPLQTSSMKPFQKHLSMLS